MNPDREELAADMQQAFHHWSTKRGEVFEVMADLAIAYADRRVAEGVTEVERICGEWGCNPKFTLLLTSAISPARDGGE